MSGTYAHAELVENLGDVVGMHTRHVQADDATTIDHGRWTDDTDALVEGLLEKRYGSN